MSGDLERIVRETFSELDTWRAVAREGFVSAADSELAADDTDWPYFGVSQVAWVGLTSATDHLQAVRAHIDVLPPNTPNLFPLAHLTLIRSALVGAATAVWVLGPDDRAERTCRGRLAVGYLHGEHLKYLRGLQVLAPGPHQGTDVVAEHVAKRQAELAAKRAADGQRQQFNTTEIIRTAAGHAFTDRSLVDEVIVTWRSGSGAAHGLPFPLFGTVGTNLTGPPDEQGLAMFAAGGSFDRLANAYMAAFRLGEHGWRLLYLRGSAASE